MKIPLVAMFILLSLFVQGQTKNVLFLGNSYTYANDLPQLTANLAASVGDTLIFDSNTPGGYTLEGHSTDNLSLEKIMQGHWDFVVLQEQSQRPSFPINQVIEDVFPFARYLDSINLVFNPCGETMFFMTWGRKNGDAGNCPTWPPVCTYQGMDSLLHLRYMMMADSNDAVVSPVGAVWRYIRNNHPSVELYSSDGSHPSVAGSYAAACSFYTTVFRKDPSLIAYNFTLNPAEASIIRSATKLVVYDSLLHWHIGEYDLVSDFSFGQISGFAYQFTNLSQNSNGQTWDFGPATVTTSNPKYTFPGPGIYLIGLESYNDCDTMVSNQILEILETNIQNGQLVKEFSIFPNPAYDKLKIDRISKNTISVGIYNTTGDLILNVDQLSENEIDISSLVPGLYYLKLNLKDYFKVIKFIKK